MAIADAKGKGKRAATKPQIKKKRPSRTHQEIRQKQMEQGPTIAQFFARQNFEGSMINTITGNTFLEDATKALSLTVDALNMEDLPFLEEYKKELGIDLKH